MRLCFESSLLIPKFSGSRSLASRLGGGTVAFRKLANGIIEVNVYPVNRAGHCLLVFEVAHYKVYILISLIIDDIVSICLCPMHVIVSILVRCENVIDRKLCVEAQCQFIFYISINVNVNKSLRIIAW